MKRDRSWIQFIASFGSPKYFWYFWQQKHPDNAAYKSPVNLKQNLCPTKKSSSYQPWLKKCFLSRSIWATKKYSHQEISSNMVISSSPWARLEKSQQLWRSRKSSNNTIDSIVNIGLAGSLSPHLEFGDVVVVEHTVEHDGFIEWDDEAQSRLYPLFNLITVEHPELKSGVLVTGDQFVASGKTRSTPGTRRTTRRYGMSRSSKGSTSL